MVSEATHRSASAFFETLDLGEVQVKGHAPVHAWEVLGRVRSGFDVERVTKKFYERLLASAPFRGSFPCHATGR